MMMEVKDAKIHQQGKKEVSSFRFGCVNSTCDIHTHASEHTMTVGALSRGQYSSVCQNQRSRAWRASKVGNNGKNTFQVDQELRFGLITWKVNARFNVFHSKNFQLYSPVLYSACICEGYCT